MQTPETYRSPSDLEIRFDGTLNRPSIPKGSLLFRKPIRIIEATSSAQVDAALEQIDVARCAGNWLAGYMTYELGYVLETALTNILPYSRTQPLLRFGVYDAPVREMVPSGDEAVLENVLPEIDRNTYCRAFEQIRAFIASGDIYQANLTFPLRSAFFGRPSDLYAALLRNHPVGYAAFVDQGPSGPSILCCSPELFFETDTDGRITTRPMKGTMPRGSNAQEDKANSEFLRTDEKNLAENTMIVDLLRNDLSRISLPGSVHVPHLHKVESYASVFQMTSTIEARLVPRTRLSDILRALFPCGSITGAPKIRAMQILRELETSPRGIYCGSIGWAAPDGSSCFNVAIRTITLNGCRATLNVGGGIVWDSTPDAEYEEALWKSRFAQLSRKAPG